jgi:hypothetical protein
MTGSTSPASGGRLWKVLLLVAIFIGGLQMPAHALTLRRGVGIHHVLNWASTVPASSGTHVDLPYKFPPFAGARYRIDDAMIAAIKDAGFDFVRLTVDPGPFLFFQGAERDAVDAILIDRIRRFREAGLAVVVDFHPNEQHARYNPATLTDENDKFPDYVKLIAREARSIAAAFADGVALEPMNEPQSGYRLWEHGVWARMQEELVAAIRKESATLPIIVTGDRGGGLEGLLALDPEDLASDPNVFFSFHYYKPYEFTHQSTGWGRPEWPYLSHMPYPADAARVEKALAAAQKAMDARMAVGERQQLMADLRQALQAYSQAATRDGIDADFTTVSDWARRHGIAPQRIFLGEFGAVTNKRGSDVIDTADRLHWLGDIRQSAEAAGFGWSLWVLKDDFGLEDAKRRNRLDPEQLKSLGLNPPADPASK